MEGRILSGKILVYFLGKLKNIFVFDKIDFTVLQLLCLCKKLFLIVRNYLKKILIVSYKLR